MLTITIEGEEYWDYEEEIFKYPDAVVLQFEHSLVSLSKWEEIYHKPFLSPAKKTEDEMEGYVRAMLVTPDVPEEVLQRLSLENVKAIDAYINDPMTGTTISNLPDQANRTSEVISAELIYFWMNSYSIPYEARSWHLNKLFTLIKVHYAKSQKPKPMSKNARVQKMAELNAQRKAKLGSKG